MTTGLELLIAQTLCPGDREHGDFETAWPCSYCLDAARRVTAHRDEVRRLLSLDDGSRA